MCRIFLLKFWLKWSCHKTLILYEKHKILWIPNKTSFFFKTLFSTKSLPKIMLVSLTLKNKSDNYQNAKLFFMEVHWKMLFANHLPFFYAQSIKPIMYYSDWYNQEHKYSFLWDDTIIKPNCAMPQLSELDRVFSGVRWLNYWPCCFPVYCDLFGPRPINLTHVRQWKHYLSCY